ncbi:unnamed protein product, partial [Iphiclides podalirius]
MHRYWSPAAILARRMRPTRGHTCDWLVADCAPIGTGAGVSAILFSSTWCRKHLPPYFRPDIVRDAHAATARAAGSF